MQPPEIQTQPVPTSVVLEQELRELQEDIHALDRELHPERAPIPFPHEQYGKYLGLAGIVAGLMILVGCCGLAVVTEAELAHQVLWHAWIWRTCAIAGAILGVGTLVLFAWNEHLSPGDE